MGAGRPRGPSRSSALWVRFGLPGLAALLLGLAEPAAAEFLGIPLERQPFIKVCPDGSIVGSLGPNLRGQPRDRFGAFVYDDRTGRTTFLKRGPNFEERLAANHCVREPIGRNRKE